MQLLSQASSLAVPDPLAVKTHLQQFLQRPEVHHLAELYVIQLAVSQVVCIIAYWIAAKPLAQRDKATMRNAVLLWLYYAIFSVLVGVGSVLFVPVAAAMASQDQLRAQMIVGGATLVAFLLIFLIPMKLYVIGFIRAFLFLLLAGAMILGGMTAVSLVLLKTTGADKDIVALQNTIFKPGPDSQKFLRRLAGQEAPDEIDRLLDDALNPLGPKASMAEREAKVRELQQKLQARSRTFPPGAPPPQAFQDQLTRYKQFLEEVKADLAAAAPPSPPPPGIKPGAPPAP